MWGWSPRVPWFPLGFAVGLALGGTFLQGLGQLQTPPGPPQAPPVSRLRHLPPPAGESRGHPDAGGWSGAGSTDGHTGAPTDTPVYTAAPTFPRPPRGRREAEERVG